MEVLGSDHVKEKSKTNAIKIRFVPLSPTCLFLGWEDTLEKEMAPHPSTLAWRIPWTEKPGRLQSMGCKESDTTERLHFQGKLKGIKSEQTAQDALLVDNKRLKTTYKRNRLDLTYVTIL